MTGFIQKVWARAPWLITAVLLVWTLLPASASGATAGRVKGSFLFGANMPWLNWNADFGGGPGGGGVSGNTAAVDSKLSQAHNAGMHMVRWWVFEGGSPQIQRDSNGTPTGLNPNVYTDIDAALKEAAKYDISYDFVLFGGTDDDSTTHQWWEDASKRQALASVLTPLFKRYASNPRAHTWEIVNEPEWQSRNGQTSVSGMLATGDAIANAIHANSPALVTVGNAQIQDMQTWAGHPLDYYSPHYYDNFGTGSNDPFVTTASSPDGKPVVIGEFPADVNYSPTAQQRWQDLYNRGYAGGWNWSLSPENTGDKIGTDFAAAKAFATGKTDLGPSQTASSPTSTPTLTPTSVASTRTPVPATPTPTVTRTWTLGATASTATIARGSPDRLAAKVKTNQAGNILLDIEVYDPNFNRVFQHYWDNLAVPANKTVAYGVTWNVSNSVPTGTYTVMVGTFKPGWGGLYSWNGNALTVSVD